MSTLETTKLYVDENGIPYLSNVGARILNLLNGVKHTVESFTELHALDLGVLENVVQGKTGPTPEVRRAIENHCPLRIRDLYGKEYQNRFPVLDDTTGGVRICTAEQTKSTERKMYRGPEGDKVLFYTYADTAMSTASLFRPEWIAEHYVHDGYDGESVPDWAFNRGHFEHQITYFIGPVNFHWKNKNKKYVARMDTGDVNYITPFVPHTFTTREAGKGLILAVTYGGAIATEEYQSCIQELDSDGYLEQVGKTLPDIHEAIATDELDGVMIRKYHGHQAKTRNVLELISGIPFQPDARALELYYEAIYVPPISVDKDRWGYNVGDTSVELLHDDDSTVLLPGDSFFICRNIPHGFSGIGKILIMEINPTSGNPLCELAVINRYCGELGLVRVHSENTQWF